ncbi:hypothetical protein BOX15_Mlig023590g1, partial [Macrostomum lignano]
SLHRASCKIGPITSKQSRLHISNSATLSPQQGQQNSQQQQQQPQQQQQARQQSDSSSERASAQKKSNKSASDKGNSPGVGGGGGGGGGHADTGGTGGGRRTSFLGRVKHKSKSGSPEQQQQQQQQQQQINMANVDKPGVGDAVAERMDVDESATPNGVLEAGQQQQPQQQVAASDAAAAPAAVGIVTQEQTSEADLEYRLQNVSRIREKDQFLSDPVWLRGLPWKILAMPRSVQPPQQQQSGDKQRTLGFFLQCNGENTNQHWLCAARAELTLVAQREGCENFSKRIMHTFHAKENDWGFATFVTWAEFVNPERGFIKDDSALLRVHVNAEAPHGMAWDSKKHTGYVGLRNQGATCYMNSLLQTLFCTNKLRRAVYQMPTEADDTSRSVPLALQRVFYELQFSDKAVGTKKLTRSFGWDTLDSFMQHDVQELCRVLLDNIEDKMKGTCVEGTIPALFEGKMLSYIRCLGVDYKSERIENFYDIQLNVKGIGNLIDSFKDYIGVETLDGDNKYDAGQHGLQKAQKGVKFVKFPPVLHLQLLRFQYDPSADQNVKINDRFEFPELLDLDEFLINPEPTPAKYFLHAVLVHTGDNYSGHYVVYINPKGDGPWCKFDDDVVSTVCPNDAIQMNYGGHDEELVIKSCTSAYMLVYIRLSAKDDVLAPVEACDIPDSLVHRLNEEKNLELAKRREKEEAYLHSEVQVFLDEDFHGWQGHEFFDCDLVPRRIYKFKRSARVRDVVNQLAVHLGRDPNATLAWHLNLRNPGMRIMYLDLNENADKELDSCMSTSQSGPYLLWLTDAFPFDKEKDLLVFLKFYLPQPTPYLAFLGHIAVPIDAKLASLLDTVRERARLPPKCQLRVFEERKSQLEEINHSPSVHIDQCVETLMDGNVLVFQLSEPQLAKEPLYSAKDFYRHFHQRLEVLFVDRESRETFSLTLSQGNNYQQLAEAVGAYLQVQPEYLQFFRAHNDQPGAPMRCTFDGTLKDFFQIYTRDRATRKLFYTRLQVRLSELESLRCFKVTWVTPKLREDRELTVSPPKDGTVADLLEEVRHQLPSPPQGRLRLLEVSHSRIFSEHSRDLPLIRLQPSKSLRAEEVPPDELQVGPNELVVYAAHFNKDTYNQFGVPFTVKIRDGEQFSALKSRIQKRLEVPDSEMEKWRFAIVSSRGPNWLENEEQTIVKLSYFKPEGSNNNRPYLGLEHVNKIVKRPRIAYPEKPIKIHN